MSTIKIKKLENFDNELQLPEYKTKQAAGADIRANLAKDWIALPPGEKLLVPTGLSFEIPEGYEVQIRPRSGLSLSTGLMVLNSPGTVDADYRGEVKILLGNLGDKHEIIIHGDRIAQIVLSPVVQANFEITEELNKTDRGSGAFGSTGLK